MRGTGRGWGRPYYRNHNTNRNITNRPDVASISKTSRIASSIRSSSSRPSTSQRPITFRVDENHGPYKYWKLYFPLEEYDDDLELVLKIRAVEEYITKNLSTFNVENIEKSSNVPLDLDHLLKDNIFITNWPTYENELSEKPEVTMNCMKLAFNKVLKLDSKLQIALINHQPVVPLSNLKVNYFGKLVTIKGTVIRVGSVGLICTSMAFKCSICHGIEAVMQPQGIFTPPTNCKACKRVAKFEALETSPYTTTMDWQTAKLQELQSQGVSGTIPRCIEIELLGELVASICPGDILSVTGIVQEYVTTESMTNFDRLQEVVQQHGYPHNRGIGLLIDISHLSSCGWDCWVRGESKGGREDGKKAARLLQLYIEAVSIHNQRNLSHPSLAFTVNDYYAIQEIYGSPDVFRLLVHSLCPSIFGHEMVKAGLILGLLGGTETDGGPRSNPHTLIVGDPGLGKSQLLQAAAHAAPRGIYVCGASASAGGLTVALGREAGGDFALEAGALVLADKGVCCVDELDKMTAHHSSLLEAMEQSTVSVAKAGVVCSLAARATVLAAANPVGGNYNRAKTVAENIKLDSALLSRFDLVFILVDQPDEKMDALLSEHVLALHSGNKSKENTANTSANISYFETFNKEMSLRDRLRLKDGEVIDPLPLVLLRKYVAYARRYVHPRLSADARTELQQFYLEMRQHQQGQGGAPVTARQLEACVRLTQARARANLQEEATVEHAKDVICLVKHSLIDTFSDEFGNIQLSRSINGSGVSSRSAVKKFLQLIRLQASRLGKDLFTQTELCALHRAGGVGGDALSLLEALNTHSYLLFKGNNLYQLFSL